MPRRLVGIRFERCGAVHYYDPDDLELDVNTPVVVVTDDHETPGWIVIAPRQLLYAEVGQPEGRVVRQASWDEIKPGTS